MEDKIKIEKEPQVSSTNDILEIARQRAEQGLQTEVYEWQFPKVLDKAIPMCTVAPMINRLHKLTVQLGHRYPNWDNDKLREFIKEKYKEFRDMADRTHPHLFTMVVDRNLSEKNFSRIQDLVNIRFLHEQSSDNDANTKLISSYFQQEFYTPKK